MHRAIIMLALTALLPASAFAQHEVFHVNPDSSEVSFTLNASDHATKGTFRVDKGSIDFDPSTANIAGLIVVAAGSGKTGNGVRDKKMTNEVLDAAHFDNVTFAPKSYIGTIASSGDSTIQATGIFTLHGAPHEITVPIQIHIEGAGCTAHTAFAVPYVNWGLKDPSILFFKVAKYVQIDLKLAGFIGTE